VERILPKAIGEKHPAENPAPMSPEEKRDLLARLLANLAHEIRNPLSSLDVHVQLLEEDMAGSVAAVSERSASRLQIIRSEIRRLETIVNQFLQLAGPTALEATPLAINAVVSHTCDLLRPQAAERGVELAADLTANLPVIEADSVKLTQALINLVINAIQAVTAGGHVRVRTFLAETPAAVVIEVADDGPGILPQDQARIFEPFYTTKPDGSGLGLWITQQIVLAHGGSLRVSSDGAHGAAFTVTLPVRRHG
jgi:two-component system sensor histidine kinase HydH